MASVYDNYDYITAIYGNHHFKGWDPRSQRPAGLRSGGYYTAYYHHPASTAAAAAAATTSAAAAAAATGPSTSSAPPEAPAAPAPTAGALVEETLPKPRKLRVVTYDEIGDRLIEEVDGEVDYQTRAKLGHVTSNHQVLRHPGIQQLLAIIPHRSPPTPGGRGWDGVGPSEVSFVYEAGTPLREAVKSMSPSGRAMVAFETVRQVGAALVHMHEMPTPIPGKEARLQPQPVNTVFLGLSLDTVSAASGPNTSSAPIIQISDLAPATKFWCTRIHACHPASMPPEVSVVSTSDNQGGSSVKVGPFEREGASKAHAFALGRLAAEISVGEPVAPVVAAAAAGEASSAEGIVYVYPWEQYTAWPKVPWALKKLIEGLTRADPAQRVSIESVLATLPPPPGPPTAAERAAAGGSEQSKAEAAAAAVIVSKKDYAPSAIAAAAAVAVQQAAAVKEQEEKVGEKGFVGLPAVSAKVSGSEESESAAAAPQQPSTPAAVAGRPAAPASDASGSPTAAVAAAAAVVCNSDQQQQVFFGPKPKRSLFERAAHRCAKRLRGAIRTLTGCATTKPAVLC